MGPIFGIVTDQRVPAAYCEELWPQALKIGQRKSNPKLKCLSLWLGGNCPETLVSPLGCVPLLALSPQPQNHSLYSRGDQDSHTGQSFHQGHFVLFPHKDAMLWKIVPVKKNCTRSELMYFAVIFIYLKKIKGYSCLFRDWIWMVTDMTWCFYERWDLIGTCGVFGFVYMW